MTFVIQMFRQMTFGIQINVWTDAIRNSNVWTDDIRNSNVCSDDIGDLNV